VAVNEPDGLEIRGADGRTDEREPASPQVGGERRAVAEGREVIPERSGLVTHRAEAARVPDRRPDLRGIPHDAGVGQQAALGRGAEPRDPIRIEAGERATVALALPEDRRPGEPGLRGLEHEEFEERPVVLRGAAPLAVVIAAKLGAPEGPLTDRHFRRKIRVLDVAAHSGDPARVRGNTGWQPECCAGSTRREWHEVTQDGLSRTVPGSR